MTPASKSSDNNSARLDTLYEIIQLGGKKHWYSNLSLKRKKQEYMLSIVKEMSSYIKSQKNSDLNKFDNITVGNIERYEKEYEELLKLWEEKYEQIKKANDSVLLLINIFKAFRLTVFVLLGIFILLYSHYLQNKAVFIQVITAMYCVFTGFILSPNFKKK